MVCILLDRRCEQRAELSFPYRVWRLCMRATAQNVIKRFPTRCMAFTLIEPLAHTDAIWGAKWTVADTIISISADGSIKQWSSKGQPHPPNSNCPSPHVLGLVSLSVTPDGNRAIYNSIEGMTALWDLGSGEVVGKYESYARGSEDAEPCMCRVSLQEEPY
jgi:WD40 repeat protein